MKKRDFLVFQGQNLKDEEKAVESIFVSMLKVLEIGGFDPKDSLVQMTALKQATEFWNKMKSDVEKAGVSKNIENLFNQSKKKTAISHLNSIVITHEEFSNLIILSDKIGYKHSLEVIELIPQDLENKKMPHLLHWDGSGEPYYEGETDMTTGELKRVITERKVMHVHFFQKETNWHCFYFTFKDIKGEHHNVEHMHYLSHLWTLDQNQVISNLRQKRHAQLGEHVKYKDAERKPFSF